MMRRVLLIYPNIANFPAINLAIPVLAGLARARDWDVRYFDTHKYQKQIQDSNSIREHTGEFKGGRDTDEHSLLPWQRIRVDLQNLIDEYKPDLIAITNMSHDYQLLLRFWPELEIDRETVVVSGGFHAIAEPDAVIESGLFDLVCTGEAEETFPEILSRLEAGASLKDIVGTYARDRESGLISRNEKRRLLKGEDLWEVAPDYSMFDDSYFLSPFDGTILRKVQVETGRGCPYSCAYCGNPVVKKAYSGLGAYVRNRPVESSINHIASMISERNIDLVQIIDECFLARNRKWLEHFFKEYRERIGKPFIIQTRPETVTEENLDLLESSGAPFFQVNIGVESGAENVLKNICERTTSIESIEVAFARLNRRRIRNCAYFMLGFPDETREDVFESINLCRRIKPTISTVSIFQPYPGTELRKRCQASGYITGDEALSSFTEGSVLKMSHLTPQELSNLRRTFILYAKLPERYYPDIERCEKSPAETHDLFQQLVKLRWELCG